MDKLAQQGEELRKTKEQKRLELQQAAGPFKVAQQNKMRAERERKQATAALAAARKGLQEARDENVRLAGSAESEQARRAAELSKMEQELAERKSKVDDLTQAVSSSLQAYEEVEPILQGAKNKVKDVEKSLSIAKRSLVSLQKSNDEFAIFGNRVRDVFNMVSLSRSIAFMVRS